MAAKGSKYEGLIKEAILALKERTGSSLPAIKKYISGHHSADTKPNWESVLSQQLKRLTASGKLIKVGLSHSAPASIQTRVAFEPRRCKRFHREFRNTFKSRVVFHHASNFEDKPPTSQIFRVWKGPNNHAKSAGIIIEYSTD